MWRSWTRKWWGSRKRQQHNASLIGLVRDFHALDGEGRAAEMEEPVVLDDPGALEAIVNGFGDAHIVGLVAEVVNDDGYPAGGGDRRLATPPLAEEEA